MSTTADIWSLPNPHTHSDLYASVPTKRAVAWVFDMVLIAITAALLLPFTLFLGILIFPVMILVVGFLYRWFSIASSSATPGMRIMGLELRTIAGERLSSGTALAHTLCYTISIAVFPLQLISILLMLTSSYKQGLTDHVLGTTALNRALYARDR